MKNKFDLGSVLIIIIFVILISLILYVACNNIVTSYIEKRAEASMYSRPSWYEITTTTTTEEPELSEEMNEAEEYEEDYDEEY